MYTLGIQSRTEEEGDVVLEGEEEDGSLDTLHTRPTRSRFPLLFSCRPYTAIRQGGKTKYDLPLLGRQ